MNIERYDYLKKVISNKKVMPFSVELHPTNDCNQDCIWCIMRDIRREGEKLTHNQLLRIAIELYKNKQTKQIFLTGGGDPLVSNELFDEYEYEGVKFQTYFELLYKLDIYPSISTNGENLTRLIDSGAYLYLDELRVSVDAGTEDQYVKLHRSKNRISLHEIVENIEQYHKISGKKIEISYLLHPINKNGYTELAQMFYDAEAVSRIVVKPLRGEKNFVCEEDRVVNGIPICFPKIKTVPEKNFATHTHIVISAKGDIYPCCHAMDYGTQYMYGNIKNECIEEVIQKKYDYLTNVWNCSRCNRLEINRILNAFYKMEIDK
ncbi:MAG: radical SAM protein [Eubacterium sp.]|nr:radical SAM protein [Eubacterium sp.]